METQKNEILERKRPTFILVNRSTVERALEDFNGVQNESGTDLGQRYFGTFNFPSFPLSSCSDFSFERRSIQDLI